MKFNLGFKILFAGFAPRGHGCTAEPHGIGEQASSDNYAVTWTVYCLYCRSTKRESGREKGGGGRCEDGPHLNKS